jgi:hypothetical protein
VLQLWIFIVAPLIGAGAAGPLFKESALLDPRAGCSSGALLSFRPWLSRVALVSFGASGERKQRNDANPSNDLAHAFPPMFSVLGPEAETADCRAHLHHMDDLCDRLSRCVMLVETISGASEEEGRPCRAPAAGGTGLFGRNLLARGYSCPLIVSSISLRRLHPKIAFRRERLSAGQSFLES